MINIGKISRNVNATKQVRQPIIYYKRVRISDQTVFNASFKNWYTKTIEYSVWYRLLSLSIQGTKVGEVRFLDGSKDIPDSLNFKVCS